MGASWTISKAMWKLLGTFWEAYGPPLERLGSLLERLQSVLEASWDVLGAFWQHFGSIPRHFGRYFNAWEASSMHFTKILRNPEKHCKVLQKSRFGESENHEKLSLEGKLGPNLEPSLLIECNFELRGAS